MNACFMTINSSEEKHLFKKSLSSGENAGKFEFHELVPSDPNQTNWFQLACEKNIRCDILVVSGHFGGSFFGASGLSLSMSEMETKSCENDCKGVMSDPKEVFLLGCNTLAGKEEDNRTASEYLNVLLADEIPMEEASRIVEQRYGAIGTSFKQNMKRVFKGVPHIYGFHSVGPSGKSIESLLNNYHKEVPNYYEHLLKIEVERGLALMTSKTKDKKVIKFLKENMNLGRTDDDKALAFYVLANLGLNDDAILKKMEQLLSSKRNVSVIGQTVPEYNVALYSFNDFPFKDYGQFKEMYSKWKKIKSQDPEGLEYFVFKPISSLSVEDQILFLEDPEFKNNSKVRELFYNNFYENDREDRDVKMPVKILPYYLQDMKAGIENLSYYLLDRIDIGSEKDEIEFIQILKEASLSKEDLKEVIQYLPKSSSGSSLIEFVVNTFNDDPTYFEGHVEIFLRKIEKPSDAEKIHLTKLLSSENYWIKEHLKRLGVE